MVLGGHYGGFDQGFVGDPHIQVVRRAQFDAQQVDPHHLAAVAPRRLDATPTALGLLPETNHCALLAVGRSMPLAHARDAAMPAIVLTLAVLRRVSVDSTLMTRMVMAESTANMSKFDILPAGASTHHTSTAPHHRWSACSSLLLTQPLTLLDLASTLCLLASCFVSCSQ